MRTPLEIKHELQVLRFDRTRGGLSLAQMAKDSRCSTKQITEAMALNASETILRRLDAYLDAGHLHSISKTSALLNRIEFLKNELYREYQARSIPMEDVMRLPRDRQIRLFNAMDWRAKRLLREKVEKETGSKIHFSDGLSYWRCKAKVISRGGIVFKDGNPRRSDGSRAVAQGKRVLQPRANAHG